MSNIVIYGSHLVYFEPRRGHPACCLLKIVVVFFWKKGEYDCLEMGVKTRDCSTIPKTTSTQLYEFSLLDDVEALSLFYFWAFGQSSIPSIADAHLVKQVYLLQNWNSLYMYILLC